MVLPAIPENSDGPENLAVRESSNSPTAVGRKVMVIPAIGESGDGLAAVGAAIFLPAVGRQ